VNVRVKIIARSPDPTQAELALFRVAISEKAAPFEMQFSDMAPLLLPAPKDFPSPSWRKGRTGGFAFNPAAEMATERSSKPTTRSSEPQFPFNSGAGLSSFGPSGGPRANPLRERDEELALALAADFAMERLADPLRSEHSSSGGPLSFSSSGCSRLDVSPAHSTCGLEANGSPAHPSTSPHRQLHGIIGPAGPRGPASTQQLSGGGPSSPVPWWMTERGSPGTPQSDKGSSVAESPCMEDASALSPIRTRESLMNSPQLLARTGLLSPKKSRVGSPLLSVDKASLISPPRIVSLRESTGLSAASPVPLEHECTHFARLSLAVNLLVPHEQTLSESPDGSGIAKMLSTSSGIANSPSWAADEKVRDAFARQLMPRAGGCGRCGVREDGLVWAARLGA